MKKFHYYIFGLSFESELELPYLQKKRDGNSDVKILIGNNPKHLTDCETYGILYEAKYNDFLFHLEGICSYRVENGEKITIEPNKNAKFTEIILFLFGTTMGALLHQREFLPLHGSAIEINNKALLIIGHSSVGKSTVAAGYAELGFSIISDDISALQLDNKSNIVLQPGLPYLKLWGDSIKYFDYNGDLARVRPQIQKYIKPLDKSYCSQPKIVHNIVCLNRKNDSGFSHEIISGIEKFNLLRNHTYRLQFVNSLGKITSHFQNLSALTNNVVLHKVERPDSPLMVFELVKYINEYII